MHISNFLIKTLDKINPRLSPLSYYVYKCSEKCLVVLCLKSLQLSCWIRQCATKRQRLIDDLRISSWTGVDNERKRENDKTNEQTPTHRLCHQRLDFFFSGVEENDFWVKVCYVFR